MCNHPAFSMVLLSVAYLPLVILGLKIQNEYCRNKQFISFKLYYSEQCDEVFLVPYFILPGNMNHPFAQTMHDVYDTYPLVT